MFAHRHCETLVLGAWGYGVFGNDADMVAAHCRQSLDTRFHSVVGVSGGGGSSAPYEEDAWIV